MSTGENQDDVTARTLRDEIAIAAISALLSCSDTHDNTPTTMADLAYEIADRMMEKRRKGVKKCKSRLK